ncbi:MAG: cupredoxin domain-containing protein [Actinomycetota bacterium]
MSDEPGGRRDLVGEVRIRLPLPIVIPLGALLFIAGVTIGISQVLLAVPKEAAVAIALVMAANVLGACAFVALRPAEARRSWAELLMIVLYPILIGLVIAQTGIGEEEEGAAAETGTEQGGAAPGGTTTEVTAKDVLFDTDALTLAAGEATSLRFVNEDSVQHNIAIYTNKSAKKSLFTGDLLAAGTTTYEIPPLDKGEYYFQCDIHPTSMFGTVTAE